MTHAPGALRLGRYAVGAVALASLLAGPAAAQMREFSGSVSRVSSENLVVGNRMGDELSFTRAKNTRVRGAKGEWGEIRISDRVTVHWNFDDEPRQARRVVVLQPR